MTNDEQENAEPHPGQVTLGMVELKVEPQPVTAVGTSWEILGTAGGVTYGLAQSLLPAAMGMGADGRYHVEYVGEPDGEAHPVIRILMQSTDGKNFASMWEELGSPEEIVRYGWPSREAALADLERYLGRQGLTLEPIAAPGRRKRPAPLPPSLRHYTFPEVKAVLQAVTDGQTGRGWEVITGEVAMRHVVEDAPLQVKFVSSPRMRYLGAPETVENLFAELRRLGLQTAALYLVVLSTVLEEPEAVIPLDALVTAIGWDPRTAIERQERRRQVWEWLVDFGALEVIGRRKGTYRDPVTKEVADMITMSPLIHIDERGYPDSEQLRLDGSTPPQEVAMLPGRWLRQWVGHPEVLSHLGDVRRLAALPAGKPSGAWAKAIGLALGQCWRERASYADLKHVGEEKRLTVQMGTFTRRQLLNLFPPAPTLDEVLKGIHPSRARTYWDGAIKILQQEGIIGSYRELAPLKASRQGWIEEWLDQPLDIRPPETSMEAVAEIAGRAKTARAARKRRKSAAAASKK